MTAIRSGFWVDVSSAINTMTNMKVKAEISPVYQSCTDVLQVEKATPINPTRQRTETKARTVDVATKDPGVLGASSMPASRIGPLLLLAPNLTKDNTTHSYEIECGALSVLDRLK